MPARQLMVMFIGAFTVLCLAVGCTPADEPKSQTFDAKGVKIHYLTAGKGEAVVLIHGLYSSAGINWRLTGVMGELARDHQVIALDLPGHGFSAKQTDKDAYGVQMVEDVVLLLDHLKIKKAHVVGYSLGGMITGKLMAKHPDRVLSGTLGGMGWFRDGSGEQKMMEKLPGGGLGPPPAFFETVGKLALTEDELKRIDLPVKVIVGDRDFAKALYVEPLQKVRKDWSVVEIKDADHISCILKPQFKEEIGAWVRKNTK
jgi:pimeloyl-ACP methyl ester carboxylesterase